MTNITFFLEYSHGLSTEGRKKDEFQSKPVVKIINIVYLLVTLML